MKTKLVLLSASAILAVMLIFFCASLTLGQASWSEQNRSALFFVSSNGMTGQEWLDRFEAKGIKVSENAKKALLSKDFKPTDDVVTAVIIISGTLLSDSARTTYRLIDEAYNSNLKIMDLEVACLIRDLLDDQQLKNMSFWWVVAMTEPVDIFPKHKKNRNGYEVFLSIDRYKDGTWFSAYGADPDKIWPKNCGFAFALGEKYKF